MESVSPTKGGLEQMGKLFWKDLMLPPINLWNVWKTSMYDEENRRMADEAWGNMFFEALERQEQQRRSPMIEDYEERQWLNPDDMEDTSYVVGVARKLGEKYTDLHFSLGTEGRYAMLLECIDFTDDDPATLDAIRAFERKIERIRDTADRLLQAIDERKA